MRSFDHTGKTIGDWTVGEKSLKNGRSTYLLKCQRGHEKNVSTQHFFSHQRCQECVKIETVKKHESRIGERSGKLTIVSVEREGRRIKYVVRCECGKTYSINCYWQFTRSKSCKACSKGSWPGKVIGNCKMIKKVSRYQWEKECKCGNIFVGASLKTDCGCVRKKKLLDEAQKKVGMTYQNLTIEKISGFQDGHISFLMRCKCGKAFVMLNGHEFKNKSCGCVTNLPTGENASKASLKNFEVIAMRELYDSGLYTIDQLSAMYKKKSNYILRIVKKHIWKHV